MEHIVMQVFVQAPNKADFYIAKHLSTELCDGKRNGQEGINKPTGEGYTVSEYEDYTEVVDNPRGEADTNAPIHA